MLLCRLIKTYYFFNFISLIHNHNRRKSCCDSSDNFLKCLTIQWYSLIRILWFVSGPPGMSPMNPRMNPPRGPAMGPMGPGSYGPGMRGPPPNSTLGPGGPGGPGPGGPGGPGMPPMSMTGPGGRPQWQPNTSTVCIIVICTELHWIGILVIGRKKGCGSCILPWNESDINSINNSDYYASMCKILGVCIECILWFCVVVLKNGDYFLKRIDPWAIVKDMSSVRYR